MSIIASPTIVDVDRSMVMTYLMDRAVDNFTSGDHQRARIEFRFFETIETMTDSEFASACICADPKCDCRS